MLKGAGSKYDYMAKIGGFFTFVANSGLGIVGWIFNWFCWKKKICCFKVYHNPIIQILFGGLVFHFYVV